MSNLANKKNTLKWWVLSSLVVSLVLIFSGMAACSGKSDTSAVPDTTEAVITYSMKTVDQLPTNPPTQPNAGFKFVIVSFNVENKGLESFKVGANSFYVEADNKICDYSDATKLMDSQLKSVDLHNGDKTSGDVAFPVPDTSSEFNIKYIGFNVNKIRWVKQ